MEEKTSIQKLSNEQLLDAYSDNLWYAGDDFSIHPYDRDDELEGCALKIEILRRMELNK